MSHKLDYDLYSQYFANDLAETLQKILREDQANLARTLADRCARNERDAINRVDEVFRPANPFGPDLNSIRSRAQTRKAEELVQEFVLRPPDAMMLVHKFLADAGVSMDDFMADALAKNLEHIERIDRLTTIAESRRNAALHEIDRHHALLAAVRA